MRPFFLRACAVVLLAASAAAVPPVWREAAGSTGSRVSIDILNGTGVDGQPLLVRVTSSSGSGHGASTARRGAVRGSALSMVLSLTREAFPAKSYAQGADGRHTPVSLASHLFYHGKVMGKPGSSVRMRGVVVASANTQGARAGSALPAALFGTIHEDSNVWVVEDAAGERHEEASVTPTMHVRHANDIELNEADFSCGHSHKGDDDGGGDDDHAHPHANASTGRSRQRRAGPANGHTQCNIYLDADQTYFDKWKGTCPRSWDSRTCEMKQKERVTIKMIDVLHLSDNIWSGDPVLGRMMKLVVAGTNVQTSRAGGGLPDMRVHGNKAEGVLTSYGYWLAKGSQRDRYTGRWTMQNMRAAGAPKANEVCTNHLFVHVDFNSGTLGVASVSAICTPNPYNRQQGPYISNVGFTTTLNRGRTSPHWQAVLTAAHELGHNFGSPHDCCSSCDPQELASGKDQICPGYKSGNYQYRQGNSRANDGSLAGCVPWGDNTGSKGGYLMYPSVANDKNSPFASKLSTCTRSRVQTNIRRNGACLKSPNPCQFGGPCCSGSVVKKSGSKCRDADPTQTCESEGRCDGVHAECPANTPKTDGAFCSSQQGSAPNHGVCYGGVCSAIHTDYCAKFVASIGFSNSGACALPGYECVRVCKSGNRCLVASEESTCSSGIMNSFRSLNGYSRSGRINIFKQSYSSPYNTCQIAQVGTPCVVAQSKANGKCQSNGACQPCGSGGCGFASNPPPISPPPSPPSPSPSPAPQPSTLPPPSPPSPPSTPRPGKKCTLEAGKCTADACWCPDTAPNTQGGTVRLVKSEFRLSNGGGVCYACVMECPSSNANSCYPGTCGCQPGGTKIQARSNSANACFQCKTNPKTTAKPPPTQRPTPPPSLATPPPTPKPILIPTPAPTPRPTYNPDWCKTEDAVVSWGKGQVTHTTSHADFGAQSFPPMWDVPLVFETGDKEGCSYLKVASNGGAIAISRGSCFFWEKALNAQRAGAGAVVIYNVAGRNPVPVMGSGGDGSSREVTIPVFFIEFNPGAKLRQAYDSRAGKPYTIDLTCRGKTSTVITTTTVTWGTCSKNQYRSASDNKCRQCDNIACGANRFRTGNCGGTANNFRCTACTACGSGKYQLAACTATANTRCAACSSAACRQGEYRRGTCSGATNGYECRPCANVVCDNNEYRSGTCSGTMDGYRCNACNNMVCSAGQFRSGECTGVTNGFRCNACAVPGSSPASLWCSDGQYRSGSCAGTTNAFQCFDCESKTCGANEYRTGSCSGTTSGYKCNTCPAGTAQPNDSNTLGLESCTGSGQAAVTTPQMPAETRVPAETRDPERPTDPPKARTDGADGPEAAGTVGSTTPRAFSPQPEVPVEVAGDGDEADGGAGAVVLDVLQAAVDKALGARQDAEAALAALANSTDAEARERAQAQLASAQQEVEQTQKALAALKSLSGATTPLVDAPVDATAEPEQPGDGSSSSGGGGAATAEPEQPGVGSSSSGGGGAAAAGVVVTLLLLCGIAAAVALFLRSRKNSEEVTSPTYSQPADLASPPPHSGRTDYANNSNSGAATVDGKPGSVPSAGTAGAASTGKSGGGGWGKRSNLKKDANGRLAQGSVRRANPLFRAAPKQQHSLAVVPNTAFEDHEYTNVPGSGPGAWDPTAEAGGPLSENEPVAAGSGVLGGRARERLNTRWEPAARAGGGGNGAGSSNAGRFPFHGHISREEALARLNKAGPKNGQYLVRAHKPVGPRAPLASINAFALTLRVKGKFVHRLIERTGDGSTFTVDRKPHKGLSTVQQVVSALCDSYSGNAAMQPVLPADKVDLRTMTLGGAAPQQYLQVETATDELASSHAAPPRQRSATDWGQSNPNRA